MLHKEKVVIKVNKKTAKYYKDKGYVVERFYGNDPVELEVFVSDLTKYSTVKVDVVCDYCGKLYSVTYKNYLRNFKLNSFNKKDCCQKCIGIKKKELHNHKINNDVDYRKKFDESIVIGSEKRKHDYEYIFNAFKERGYTLKSKEYKNNKQKLQYICEKHNLQEINFHNFMQGKGCPLCAKEKFRKGNDEFRKELNSRFKHIKQIDEYVNNDNKMRFYCEDCGDYFYSRPRTILKSKHGCPFCCANRNEKILYDYIKTFHENVERQKKFDDLIGIGGGLLSYDFYLEFNGRKILIERQGEQHDRPIPFNGQTDKESHEQFLKQIEHDERKCKYAKENGYELIEVWYYEDYKQKLNQYGLCK